MRLYKGTVKNIAEAHGYKGVACYQFTLQLKEIFPYSYIYDPKNKVPFIAKQLHLDRRTVKKRLQLLLDSNFAAMEKNTYRFLSGTQLKRFYTTQPRNYKYAYRTVNPKFLSDAMRLQPIIENINKQKAAIRMKSPQKNSGKIPQRDLSFCDLIQRAPNARAKYVDITMLSQEKAAKLLGYKSKASGHKQLKKLADARLIEISSNRVEMDRAKYNRYKETDARNLLIIGKGSAAKFYFLLANTVEVRPERVVKSYTKGKYFEQIYW